MNVVVLVKQVPDTEAVIKIAGDQVNEGAIPKWIISPYDEYALEEAIQIKEKTGGSVTAISLGGDKVVEALRTAYALGVDNAIHIKADEYNSFDGLTIARGIQAALNGVEYDVILAGRQAIDSNAGQVPFILAELLGIPQVMWATELNLDGGNFKAKREIEGGTASVEGSLPALVTCTKGLNEPRYPSLKGIMASKKKKIEAKEWGDLGVSEASTQTIVKAELPPPRPEGRILEAETGEDYAQQLVKAMREEIKVI